MKNGFSNEKRTDKLEIRIEPTLKELIADIAFKEQVSISDYVRTLLIKEVEHKKMLKQLRRDQ